MSEKRSVKSENKDERSMQVKFEKNYRELESELQKATKWKKSKVIYLLCVVVSVLFAIIVYYTDSSLSYPYEFSIIGVGVAIFIGILLGLTFALTFYICFEMQEIHLQSEIFKYEVEDVKKKVEDDIFENSIKMSYKYLDQYYLQTRDQAQRGFYVTVFVAVFGAMLIFSGVGAMFFGKVEPSYITCASGVVTEFIAAIFFYLYNKTVSSMSKYHNKLVLSQNISIALKISDSLPPDDKVKTKNLIVNELLKDINSYLVKNDSSDTPGK